MKKILVLILLLAGIVSAQKVDVIANSTIANSASVTAYIDLSGETTSIIDSIALQGIYTGEIDVDKLIVTKGGWKGNTFVAIATPDTTVLTVDNAASAVTGSAYTSNSLGLDSLEGYDAVKVVVVAGGSGNDATDPNAVLIKKIVFRRPAR